MVDDRRTATDSDASPQWLFLQRSALLVALAGAAFVLWQLSSVVLAVFGGLLFATVIRRIGTLLADRLPLGPTAGTALVLVALFTLAGAGAWQFGSNLTAQFEQLTATLQTSYQAFQQWLQQHGLQTGGGDPLQGSAMSWVKQIGTTVWHVMAGVLLVVFVALYVALSPRVYRKGLLLLFPAERHERVGEVLDAIDTALWRWMLGQFVSMVVVGSLTWLVLSLLGVPMAGVLGLIAGLLEFVPVLGPWLAAVPAVMVAAGESGTLALLALAAYVGVQQAESWIITPMAERYAVALPPAVSLAAVAALGLLFGTTGVLFATPLALTIMVLVRMLYIEDVLHERPEQTRMPQ